MIRPLLGNIQFYIYFSCLLMAVCCCCCCLWAVSLLFISSRINVSLGKFSLCIYSFWLIHKAKTKLFHLKSWTKKTSCTLIFHFFIIFCFIFLTQKRHTELKLFISHIYNRYIYYKLEITWHTLDSFFLYYFYFAFFVLYYFSVQLWTVAPEANIHINICVIIK